MKLAHGPRRKYWNTTHGKQYKPRPWYCDIYKHQYIFNEKETKNSYESVVGDIMEKPLHCTDSFLDPKKAQICP